MTRWVPLFSSLMSMRKKILHPSPDASVTVPSSTLVKRLPETVVPFRQNESAMSLVAMLVPVARDKSISEWDSKRHGDQDQEKPPLFPLSRFPLLDNPGKASQLFQKTACRCRTSTGGAMRSGIAGGELFHQQPGLWEPATGGGAGVRSALPLSWGVDATLLPAQQSRTQMLFRLAPVESPKPNLRAALHHAVQ
jgi:hypothetical protein